MIRCAPTVADGVSMRKREKTSVLGYARVSTEEQVVGGVSLASQVKKIEDYSTANGLDLIEVVRTPGSPASAPATDPAPVGDPAPGVR